MKLDIQAICHKGLVRGNNEDAVSIGGLLLRDDSASLSVSTPDDGYFYLLVSDGMGGHEDGEEASRFTLDEFKEQLAFHQISPERFEDEAREAASYISLKLNRAAAQRGQSHPMGCTLTGVIWHYGRIWLVNAGDSRSYRFRQGVLRLLTTDDNERGLTGNPEAGKLLLNCLGGGCAGHLHVQSLEGKLMEGDTLLICSDGLSDMLGDEEIEEALCREDCSAESLFLKACERGGTDNISVILAKIIG